MKKETLKTTILTLLIFSSVILSVQLLLNNPAWTDEYSLLSIFKGVDKKSEEAININDTGALSSVFSPSSFLLTFPDGRLYYSTTQTEGKDLRAPFNETLKKALQSADAENVTEKEWQDALQKPSIYADYFVPISTDAMSAFLGNSGIPSGTSRSFDQIVVSFDAITSGASLYLRDSAEKKQSRIYVDSAPSLIALFSAQEKLPKQSYAYAFELNLDKKMEDEIVRQNVLLGSYVLLPLEPHEMDIIRAESVTINEATTNKILPLFGYNPKIARKFTEKNGNQLFVEQDSTLTINPETGYIEYAAESGSGIALPGDGSLSSNATGCGKLIDDLFNLFEVDPNVTLFINTPLTETAKKNYTISFGYLFDGNRIISQNNGCEIAVENGKITSFKANIKNYKLIAAAGERHAIEVLDHLYSTQQQDILIVDKLYTGYTDGAGDLPLTWKAGIQGSEEIITVE